MDIEESHRCGRLGSSGEINADEHVSRNGHRSNGKVQEREGVPKTQEESTSRTMDTARTPEGLNAGQRGRLQM